MNVPEWYGQSLAASERIAGLGVFFAFGCQKSGTTWLQHLLNGHPEVCCNGEGHITDVLMPCLQQALKSFNDVPKTQWGLRDQDLLASLRLLSDGILSRYVDTAADPAAVRMVGDKTPEASMALPLLNVLHPGARFVHILRDGRDGAVSGWAHLRREGSAGRFPAFADYAAYFAKHHWVGYIHLAREAAKAFPERYLEMRYERLHEDPHAEIQRLLSFLGVDASGAAVEACVRAGAFETLSGGRQRGEERADSQFRKGLVGEWRSFFDEDATARFEAEAGPLLRELGYADAG